MPCGEAVLGIIEIFKKKFYHPPVLIVKRCYEILVYVLDQLYQNASALEHTGGPWTCVPGQATVWALNTCKNCR